MAQNFDNINEFVLLPLIIMLISYWIDRFVQLFGEGEEQDEQDEDDEQK